MIDEGLDQIVDWIMIDWIMIDWIMIGFGLDWIGLDYDVREIWMGLDQIGC